MAKKSDSRSGRPADPDSLRGRLREGDARQLRVIVPTATYKRLKVRSVLTDRSLSDIAADALAEWLERHSDDEE